MKHRIFIAINLPEDIKKKLVDFKDRWEFLPGRWTRKDSLHLTLVFIGYASDDETYEICRITRRVAQKHEPFLIDFEKILYGPPGKAELSSGKRPRMIWLKGKASEELSKIKKETENALMSSANIGSFRTEQRSFAPHITLARMKMGEWHKLDQLPKIEQDFKHSVWAASLDIMEIDLKRDGAEYTILESCPLGEIK
jgi:2'-5' RNA ligase